MTKKELVDCCNNVFKIEDDVHNCADFVGVVMCKDCKHRHSYDCPIGLWVEDNWFCYKGEQGESKQL